ncbi:hypothetical protein GW17_00052824 [Ensete ventricosum]|nr:hypothetical protein GW17_00052824 [Ensete ventricosum]
MTGESKIVNKKAPFLMSGCKVADGYGTMLVTAVGINTEWGLLMASISEDAGEETPLQVFFPKYFVTIVVVAVPEGLPLAVTLTFLVWDHCRKDKQYQLYRCWKLMAVQEAKVNIIDFDGERVQEQILLSNLMNQGN